MSPYLVPGGWSKLYSSVMNMRGLLAVLLIPLLCCQDVAGEGEGILCDFAYLYSICFVNGPRSL